MGLAVTAEVIEVFLNENSANSENMRNHWSMNWSQLKDPLPDAVVASWFLTQETVGSNTLLSHRYFTNSVDSADSIKFRKNSIIKPTLTVTLMNCLTGCLPQVWTDLEAMRLEIGAEWYSCYSIWRMPSINQWMQNQSVSVMVTTQWRSWYWIVPYLDSEKEETHLDGQYKTLVCIIEVMR